MIKLLNVSRSPATAAAGSAVLIVTALVGVILAAGAAADPSSASTSSTSTSAPLNAAPLVLPKPCVVTKNHQTCDAAATKTHRAKQVKKHPAQAAPPPVSPATASPASP
ncbi:MAG TPA: hypothetical protein VND88_08805 [Candidatus Acidoferrales bacterium]|nr:hypothetical protein [Candidatus Acidoferrales bacterium]